MITPSEHGLFFPPLDILIFVGLVYEYNQRSSKVKKLLLTNNWAKRDWRQINKKILIDYFTLALFSNNVEINNNAKFSQKDNVAVLQRWVKVKSVKLSPGDHLTTGMAKCSCINCDRLL